MKAPAPTSSTSPLPSGRRAAARRRRRRRAPETGRHRAEVLQRHRELLLAGSNRTHAARELGYGRTTLWRWTRRLELHGPDALIPKAKGPPPAPALLLGLLPENILRAQALAVRKGSASAGWRAFALGDDCPPALRSVLAPDRKIPVRLRHALGLTRRVVIVRLAVLRAGQFTRRTELGRAKRRTAA